MFSTYLTNNELLVYEAVSWHLHILDQCGHVERVNLRPKLTQAQHSNLTQVCSQTLRQDAPQNCAENVRASCFCYNAIG